MADVSKNIKRFASGKYGVTFRAVATEASVTHLFEYSDAAGDNTVGLPFVCNVEYMQLSCGTGGNAHILDGSAGKTLVAVLGDTSDTAYSETWDWRDDPLVCLTTADNTSVLCVDMTEAGAYQGFIKYSFGS